MVQWPVAYCLQTVMMGTQGSAGAPGDGSWLFDWVVTELRLAHSLTTLQNSVRVGSSSFLHFPSTPQHLPFQTFERRGQSWARHDCMLQRQLRRYLWTRVIGMLATWLGESFKFPTFAWEERACCCQRRITQLITPGLIIEPAGEKLQSFDTGVRGHGGQLDPQDPRTQYSQYTICSAENSRH